MKNLLIAFLLGTTLVLGFLYLQPAPQLGATPSNEFSQPVVFHNEVTLNNCATATWNPGSIATSTLAAATSTSITLTGLALGDVCLGSLTSATTSDAQITCTATAANTAILQIVNLGAAAVDYATGTAKVCYFD